jgi:hypothetical protein
MKNALIGGIVVAAGLSLAMAGPASAAALGHPKPHPKPKPAAAGQFTGKQLASALLPASDFGSGYTLSDQANSGSNLRSAQASQGYACGDLNAYEPFFGQTAEAYALVTPPSNLTSSSNSVVIDGDEDVSQFASAGAAWSYLMQLQSSNRSCKPFTTSFSGSGGEGTVTVTVTTQGVSWTKVSGNSGVIVAQTEQFTDSSGDDITLYVNSTVVDDGTDVYTVSETNTANADVAGSLVTSLIDRVQALKAASRRA